MIVESMLESIELILLQIKQHPFNTALRDGSLSKETFIFYLIQDAHYLSEFSRALAITAGRLPHTPYKQQFLKFALNAIEAEHELHQGFIQREKNHNSLLKLDYAPSPTCFSYSNYLLKMACMNSVEEAVASMLPCFLIYNLVAKTMGNANPQNPYYDWIALYAGSSFESTVQAMVNITNALGFDASILTRQKMIDAFMKASQLEWMFWQSAYVRENWTL